MFGFSEMDIIEATNIPLKVLTYHTRTKTKNWSKEFRKNLNKELEEMTKAGRGGQLHRIQDLTIYNLTRFLIDLARRPIADMTVKDAKLVSDIHANMDRVARLESGTPTEIRKYDSQPASLREKVIQVVSELQESDEMVNYEKALEGPIEVGNVRESHGDTEELGGNDPDPEEIP